MDEYEKIFQSVTSVVFGRQLTGHRDYEGWLTGGIPGLEETRSAMSGKKLYYPVFGFYEAIRQRLLGEDEAYGTAGKSHLSEEQVKNLSLSGASGALRDISATTVETAMGSNSRMAECSVYFDSSVCFRTALVGMSSYALYSFWPRQSKYVAGCHYAFSCSFCIRCFNSENLTRCFEVSDSSGCSDCYFCYNCENLQDCMFCFNTKSKKHAIGNVELPLEQYRRIKAILLEQLAEGLGRDKTLKRSVYDIRGSQARKQLGWRKRA